MKANHSPAIGVFPSKITSLYFVSIVFSLICCATARAQIDRAELEGTVTDSSGAAIAGASVSALNKDNGLKRTVATGPTGAYRMDAMDLGAYSVTVRTPKGHG